MVRSIIFTIVMFISISAQNYLPPSGPWWGAAGMTGDAELMMVDIKVPTDGNFMTTYWSTINFKIGPRGGYLGIQNNLDRPLNNIFSIWDLKDGAGECRFSWKGSNTVVEGFGGEGTGIHSHNDMGWIPGNWYTTMIRRWYSGGDSTSVGFWMYDHSNAEWTQYVTLVTPERDAKLSSDVGGFIENFWQENGWDERSAYIRQPWKYTESGVWIKPTSFTATSNHSSLQGWAAEMSGSDELYLKANGPNIAAAADLTFPYSTIHSKSPLAQQNGVLDSIYLVYNQYKKAIEVHWLYDKSKPIQLEYQLTLSSVGSGTPITLNISRQSAGERMYLHTLPDSISNYQSITATISGVDIFDGMIQPKSQTYTVGQDSVYSLMKVDPSLISVFSTSDAGAAENIQKTLDGNPQTFWQSQWSPETSMPHTLLYQFSKLQNIRTVRLMNRQGNTNGFIKSVKIQTGPTAAKITNTKEIELPFSSGWIDIPISDSDVKILRVIAQSNHTNTNIASLSEVEFLVEGDGDQITSNKLRSSNTLKTPMVLQSESSLIPINLSKGTSLQIIDLLGNVVFESPIQNEVSIETSISKNGVYFAIIKDAGATYKQKIILNQ